MSALIANVGSILYQTPAAIHLTEDIDVPLSATYDTRFPSEEPASRVLSVISVAAGLLVTRHACGLRGWGTPYAPGRAGSSQSRSPDDDEHRQTATLNLTRARRLDARVPAALIEAVGDLREPVRAAMPMGSWGELA